MQNEWQQFLTEQGATHSDAGISVFGDPQNEIREVVAGTNIISLDHFGIIQASGEDVQSFLQGQLTNDITLTGQDKMQISGYCNPKGRMLAQFLIIPWNTTYLLLVPRTILEPTLKRLKMYVMRSQVELTDVSNTYICIGFAGSDIEQKLSAHFVAIPVSDYDCSVAVDQILAKFPGVTARYLAVLETTAAKTLWLGMKDAAHQSGPGAWFWMDIHAGIPTILPETVEEFVPQMVNLEILAGVNFKKGCYTGQEIVARMHYLGKAKRRMYRLSHAGDSTLPAPGTDLYDAEGDTQSVGKIVMAQPSPIQGIDMLAVIQNSHVKQTGLHLESQTGPALSLESLPYAIDIDG